MIKKFYVTALIFIKENEEETFNEYETSVLPLLGNHNGELVYRIKQGKNISAEERPDEIHILTFGSKEDFENYKNDPERKKHMHLYEKSVLKTEIYEGYSN